MSDITVSLDNRARLVTAVLAASDWPDHEQTIAPHAVHQHSKQTRHFVAEFTGHTAVTGLNQALAVGVTLTDLFTAAMRCSWPDFAPQESLPTPLADGAWVGALPDFYRQTGLEQFWAEHASFWDEAQTDLTQTFAGSQIFEFLSKLHGQPLTQSVNIIPTLVYPMLEPVLAATASTIFLILPPAKAWGESPPWPFGEDPGWVVAQTCRYLVMQFMADTLAQLDENGQGLLTRAAVTLCLEQAFDEFEAQSYLVRTKKEYNLPQLPQFVETLRQMDLRFTIDDLRLGKS